MPTAAELFDLKGKVALVTGATGHLGSAIACGLAEAGASVIATSRKAGSAQAAASSLPILHAGQQHHAIELDQTAGESIDRCFAQSLQLAGQVDVLINNAHEGVGADWTSITPEEFNRQMTNATGYFLLARHLRDHAVKRHSRASIVMLASMYGLVASYPDVYEGIGAANPVAYQALKGGVIQMTRHLAVYWAQDGVRVNALSPGPFSSDKADPRSIERLIEKSPVRRIGKPDELKGAIVFLASEASSYVTGHNLVVDGGWTAW